MDRRPLAIPQPIPGGTICWEASRSEQRCIAFGADEESRSLLAQEGWGAESLEVARDRGEAEVLLDLPPLPPPASADELGAGLEARFAAHPLASQLPSTTRALEGLLEQHQAPLEVARLAAGALCPVGFARALGQALADERGDLSAVCHLARAGTLLWLAIPDEMGRWPRLPAFRLARALWPELDWPEAERSFFVCEWKLTAVEALEPTAGRRWLRILDADLRRARTCVERALALPPEELRASFVPPLPGSRQSAEAALAGAREELAQARPRIGSLAEALRDLVGQPPATWRGLLVEVLSQAQDPAVLLLCVEVVATADLDLTEAIARRLDRRVEAAGPTDEELARRARRSRRIWTVAFAAALAVAMLLELCGR